MLEFKTYVKANFAGNPAVTFFQNIAVIFLNVFIWLEILFDPTTDIKVYQDFFPQCKSLSENYSRADRMKVKCLNAIEKIHWNNTAHLL